jgi:hypothetical protein
MIETQAGGLRQRCSPSLDRWQVAYHLDQANSGSPQGPAGPSVLG